MRFTLEAWQTVWTKYPLAPAFLSSLKLTGLATLLTVLLAPAAAYAFQFLKFPGRRILLLVIVNSFVLPQQVVIIPLFTLWRDLHMIDNVWAVLIPFVGLSFAWSIFLVQSFLAEFPRELIEASKLMAVRQSEHFFMSFCPTPSHPWQLWASCNSCGAGIPCCCPCCICAPMCR